ncbi:MAG: gamma-glutamyltransferase [Sinobacteraceae bacterium]|nr:gamma-glutamyltransferase [Nevskiaceae bacterium]
MKRSLCGLLPLVVYALLASFFAAPLRAGPAAIAIPDSHGAEVAEAVLREGGNAIDAAVATAFVLAVTYPEAGNLGGGGFITLHHQGNDRFLDFREAAPERASRDMYLDAQGNYIKDSSLIGHRAAGVPGTVAGLWEAHRLYGTRPWKSLLQPAIRLARDGFVPHPQLIERTREAFADYEGKTNFRDYFGPFAAGDAAQQAFRQPELAATLQRIAERGAQDFYAGRTAQLLVAEMRRGGGLISREDLRRYRAIWRAPLQQAWRGYTLVTAPPPSSGGIALVQLLGMKDVLAAEFKDAPYLSRQYVHLIAEIEKRVFADRAEYLGDPDFFKVPVNALVAPSYLRQRAQQVDRTAISSPTGVKPGLGESLQTTHFSILDAAGNAVSLTYTLNGSFGNGVVVRGAGFLLNNEMDDFSVKPGVPNLYGVVGAAANEIAPRKRMLSSMTPTILLKDGVVQGVLGTPGGSTIFTSVFQTLINLFDHGMTAGEAVAAPRFHHQLLPGTLIIVSRCCNLPEQTRSELTAMGYDVRQNSWEFGDMQVIQRTDSGTLTAASDPRGRGQARVFEVTTPAAAPEKPRSRPAAVAE